MQLTILKLILWPKDPSKPTRQVTFAPGVVNVITGESRSGKSALTAIIDYVLGSGSCAIPVGPIRDLTAWFGLLLQAPSKQVLVAREEPGDRRASGACAWHQGAEVPIPARPDINASLEELKDALNRMARLSDLPLDEDSERGFQLGRPSFRDMVAFNFLPQYIVANPYALFYKADRPDHREKLRAIFPLVLGVDSRDTLALREEQRRLQRELRPLLGELRQNEEVRNRWFGNAFAFWTRAKELGLVPVDAPTPREIDSIVTALGLIVRGTSDGVPPPQPGTGERTVEAVEALRRRERELSAQIGDQKRRLKRLVSLAGAAAGYSQALSSETGRLGGLGWFEKHLSERAACPMCGSHQDSARQELARLQSLAADLSEETQTLDRGQPLIDRERAETAKQLQDLEERYRLARESLQQLEQQTGQRPDGGIGFDQARFLGRLEQALADSAPGVNQSLKDSIRATQDRLAEIADRLDAASRRERLQTALSKISRDLTENARLLELERAEEVIELDVQALNLRFSDVDRSRRDMLSDLGSGENWMGYHIATFLALHQAFAAQSHSPVPGFLVIDQPSQVYFPAEILDEYAQGKRSDLADKDKRATRRIFEALAARIARIGAGFQVIVTEHADEDIWGGVEKVRLVERWRGEADYLIPRAWLD
jgi:hypothetical protein